MTHIPRTCQGRAVIENQVDRLARGAEAGCNPAELRHSGWPKPIGSATSEVIRDPLHAWLKSN